MASSLKIPEDKEILEMLRSDRHLNTAVKQLYRSYFEYTGQYVVNNNGSWDDAEDVFQEVVVAFIHLVRNNRFRGESSIKTFLYSLNRNLWLNELKRKGRAEVREAKYESAREHNQEGVLHTIESRECTNRLMQVMEALGESCKKILLLYYFDNRSMKEILQELHYENEQVVRNKKYKCLKKLEQMISGNKTLYNQLKNYLHG